MSVARVRDVMTRDVVYLPAATTLDEAARAMRDADIGDVVVTDGPGLFGMVTDRDIVIRAVCEARSFETPVTDVMTADVEYCYEDDDITAAADKMAELQVRRLIVLDHDQRLVGIVSLGDIAQQGKDKTTGQALEEISEPNRH